MLASIPSRRSTVAGFSLIEMMISIAIGLVIIGALVGVVVSNANSAKTNDRVSELQTNARFALDHLKKDLRNESFRGYTWANPISPTIAGVSNECLDAGGTANSFVTNLRQGIWGADDSDPYPANCLPTAKYSRGDVLVIRRLDGTPVTTLAANNLYFRSNYAAGQLFQGTVAPTNITGVPLADFSLQEEVFYIGTDDVDATVPALRRVHLQGNAMVDEEVVSGIENMQIQYGLTATNLTTQYFDANGIVGTSTNTSSTDWDNINSVRVWILARNTTAEAGYTDTTINGAGYAMGNVTYTHAASDHYRRLLLTSVVQLRNWGH